MSILPLQTKIDFIENVVIFSFGDPLPFTFTSNDDYKSSRNAWIRTQIDYVFPNLSNAEKNQLMLLSNTIPTLEEAKEKLAADEAEAERAAAEARAERAAAEARAERAAERQFLREQGD